MGFSLSSLFGRAPTVARAARRLRWFFALNEASVGFLEYINLVHVAVHTARTRTGLDPVCIYDGGDNVFTAWLQAAGVPVVRRRTFFADVAPDMSSIPRGAYLRFEIPGICREYGWNDEYVLYTDCDVMFETDVVPRLLALRPKFLAVGPEHDPQDYTRFNSGVMLINVPALAAEMPALVETFRANYHEVLASPFDQALLQKHFAGRIDRLPLELNWKSYWPANPAAAVIHFHGPKPAQKYLLLNHRAPAGLLELANAPFYAACRRWDDALMAAIAKVPVPNPPDVLPIEPGWGGFDDASGLGIQEGPCPQIFLPYFRLGLAPATVLTFTVPPGRRARLEALFQSPDTTQVVTVSFGGHVLAQVPVRRVSDPHSLAVDLPAEGGPHQVTLSYAHGAPQSPDDPRPMAVLYRALRVRFL
jgi:hypothetical protein